MPENVRPFPNEASRASLRRLLEGARGPADPAPPESTSSKLGLYPLGEDVIVSKALYDLILTGLEHATQSDRAQIATMMRAAYAAHFAP